MNMIAYTGADVFDGTTRHKGAVLLVQAGHVAGIVAPKDTPQNATRQPLDGGTIGPGFVDLQVNGGDGVLLNDDQSVTTLTRIASAHLRLGTTALLPTLITDTPARVAAAIDAVEAAIAAGIAGVIGLHLEGPHLSVARKGAHSAELIHPMTEPELATLLDAAKRLPHLMVTVAPENVTPTQISALRKAGVIVSLGHTDAPYDDCMTAINHGATCATHLFNAMSQMNPREPGLVGAALNSGAVHAGLIADAVHVHPASIRAALAAKQGPASVFLVTDAMAVAGTDLQEFTLNGRTIYRNGNILTLDDGTLAGADLDMATALGVMVERVGVTPDEAIKMATSLPAAVLNDAHGLGTLKAGTPANFVHLNDALKLQNTWLAGQQVRQS